ncbi:MAG TPA: hypothetical protein VF472_04970 [Burkholderiaceae bacterium]
MLNSPRDVLVEGCLEAISKSAAISIDFKIASSTTTAANCGIGTVSGRMVRRVNHRLLPQNPFLINAMPESRIRHELRARVFCSWGWLEA